MKTEQEIRQMVNTCKQYHSCALCPYNPEDISRFIGDRWKGGCPNYDRQLVYAMGKGYGDVSEYKAEIERLRQEVRDTDKMARNTIEQYRAENKELENALKQSEDNYSRAFERLKAQEREIERLKDKCEELRNEKWNAQDDLDCYCDEMPNKIKRAKIDMLNELKERAVGLAAIETYHICNLIDELIKEVEK